MLQAVIKLYAGNGKEEEDIEMVIRLRQQLPHSKIGGLISYDDRELTPEQVFDEAMWREAEFAGTAAKD